MQADIMAGKGPDLIYISENYFARSDVDKMIHSGVFSDMTPFIKADKEFDFSNYNASAMKFGVVDGKRYIMPTSYNIPMLLTTQSLLDKVRFDPKKCTDFWSFNDELNKYSSIYTENMPNIFTSGIYNIANFNNLAGMKILNYEDKKVLINTPEFKRAAQTIHNLCIKNDWYYESYVNGMDTKYLYDQIAFLANYDYGSFGALFNDILALYAKGEKPIFFPIRDLNGKIQGKYSFGAAITNNSSNKQNAYNFVKLLLSEQGQMQFNSSPLRSIPVLNSAVDKAYEYFQQPITMTFGDSTFPLPPLAKEDFDLYKSYLKDVDKVTAHGSVQQQLDMLMLPYYLGKKSYEECIKEAQDALEIYMSE